MADCGSLNSPKENYRQPTSPFLCSPRLFNGFVSKGSSDDEFINSPTSILDGKPFSALKNPLCYNRHAPKTPKSESKNLWEKLDSRGACLGLADALIDEKSDPNLSNTDRRMVLFGSKLNIQVSPLPPSVLSPTESPKSPGDFGVKTRHCHLSSFSPGLSVRKTPFGCMDSGVFSSLSVSEMELSEDYTCVISYGPNPRTTHIFDDCIVESCCGIAKLSESRKENGFFSDESISCPSERFLSFCYNCKKNLGQGKDIYMGEKAFCSSECRCKGVAATESDHVYGTSS